MPAIDLSILNQRQTPAFFADVFANRPPAGFVGRVFISTDTFIIYRDNGTSWNIIGGGGAGAVTGSGANGQVSFWNGASTITGSNNLFWDNVNGHLGIGTVTPGTALGINHSQNQIIQLNQTTATNDTKIAFQNSGTPLWRIGNSYSTGANNFAIFDVVSNLNRLIVSNTGAFTFNGSGNFTTSLTAVSGIADAVEITSTLIASANSDVLVGLDINPTFTNGAFSNVANAGIRISGQLYIGLGKSSVATNTVIGGAASGRNITTASNTTIIGSGSGNAITSSTGTTIIGAGSGASITTSNNNTIIGAVSCVSGGGTNNTTLGSGIMGGTVSGGNNTGVGRTSLSALTSGTNNTALGMSSLFSLTTGASNTSVGYEALLGITTPSFNIALGNLAGLKFGSGTSNNILSSGSVFIGYDTRPSASGNSNEIVISGYTGSGIGAVGLGSNTTSIGNSSTTRTYLFGSSNTTVANRLNVLNVTDNALFDCNVNGSIYCAGFSPNQIVYATNQTLTRTNSTAISTGNNLTFTLPSASGINNIFVIKHNGTGTLTVTTSQTIVNMVGTSVTSIVLTVGQCIFLQANGNNVYFQLV